MANETAGRPEWDDWVKWLPLLMILARIGILPKSWRVPLSTLGALAALYRISKYFGWL